LSRSKKNLGIIKKVTNGQKKEKNTTEQSETAFYSILFALLCPQPAKRA
jgi:hypothetical protein